jgi:hypothetical protein
MTNARCLTEGVDVPAIDCVMFADPKQSRVDIVQAAGRALRQYQGKEYGYIVIPLIIPENMAFEKFAETTAFRQVAQTITALSTQDERIADEFRAIEQGRVSSGKIVETEGDIPAGMKMKIGDFAKAISTRAWESVGRANWRKFEDARAFVRNLRFKSQIDWFEYCKSGKNPADIPTNPGRAYGNDGWVGFGDWLGTGIVSTHLRNHRSFREARAFARGLELKSGIEWSLYCKSGRKPADIPAAPQLVYARDGWVGMGDWLGTGIVATYLHQYRSFKQARAFARSLGLKSIAEWRAYCKSGRKPVDISASPDKTYGNVGWAGMGDWLGTGRVVAGQHRPFKKARTFVLGLGLKTGSEWREYNKSGKKPADIPAYPDSVYANQGWAGMGDWLGTGTIAARLREYRSFEKARAFVRGLQMKSSKEWSAYCKSGKKPADIPNAPQQVYANQGWAGMGDWLGTGTIAAQLREYRSFRKARAFVRGLRLKSVDDWYAYCKSGEKPVDMPAAPHNTYSEAGWAGIADWLGYVR